MNLLNHIVFFFFFKVQLIGTLILKHLFFLECLRHLLIDYFKKVLTFNTIFM